MKLIVALFLLSVSSICYSQDELAKLNELGSPKYEFKSKKSGVLVSFVKNGEVFRTDWFLAEEIDPDKISLIAEESSIQISCYEHYPQCIDRKIIKMKSRQPYPSATLKMSDNKKAEQMVEILKGMCGKSE